MQDNDDTNETYVIIAVIDRTVWKYTLKYTKE